MRGIWPKGASTLLVLVLGMLAGACQDEKGTLPPPITRPSSPAPAPAPAPTPPSVDLTGDYELTFVASPTCALGSAGPSTSDAPLPESARIREYAAHVTQDADGHVKLTMQHGVCAPCSADGGGVLDAALH